MTNDQPTALRLADAIEQFGGATTYQAATELRRLHTENERLSSALKGAELGSRANFASMQQEAVKKSELLEALTVLKAQCELMAASDWRKWEELASPEEFERWVKSRAAHMAVQASIAIAKAEAK